MSEKLNDFINGFIFYMGVAFCMLFLFCLSYFVFELWL